MIVSLPLSFSKLVPDDWEKWWNLWKEYALPVERINRVTPNPIPAPHIGFDVLKKENFRPTYTANYLDLESIYPTLFNQIKSLPFDLHCARFLMSTGQFHPHIDNFVPSWSIRSMFYCTDPESQWYYTKKDNTEPKYLTFPETTNWWAYYDGKVKHATYYRKEYPKIILQIYANPVEINKYVQSQFNIFPEHQIEYDND